MLGIGFGEFVLIFVVLLLVVGPDRLPTLMKTVGRTIRGLRNASRDIRSAVGIDEIMREDFTSYPTRKVKPPANTLPSGDDPTTSPQPAVSPTPATSPAAPATPAAEAPGTGAPAVSDAAATAQVGENDSDDRGEAPPITAGAIRSLSERSARPRVEPAAGMVPAGATPLSTPPPVTAPPPVQAPSQPGPPLVASQPPPAAGPNTSAPPLPPPAPTPVRRDDD